MPHIHEKIDFTVEVFIVYQNKVLLRKHDKYGIWLSVGGHIEFEEDPNEAAIREAREEVGIDIILFDHRDFENNYSDYKELIPPIFLNRHKINEVHEHITLVYFAISQTDRLELVQNEEKSQDCKWFTKDELIQNEEVKKQIKFYALCALGIVN